MSSIHSAGRECLTVHFPLEDISLSQNLDLFELLTKTYPRYVDNVSREAVEAVLVDLIRRDELRGIQQKPDNDYKLGVTERVLGWLNAEVDRISG